MKKSTFFSFLISAAFLISAYQAEAQSNIAPLAVASQSGGGVTIYGPANYNDQANVGGTGLPWGWVRSNGWIQYTWPSPVAVNQVIMYPNNRPLTGGTLEYWDGSTWVFIRSIGPGANAVPLVLDFSPVTTTQLRMNSLGGSNPNFTEIEVYEALLGANNAAVAGLDSPKTFCPGTENIIARIANRGINQINSVTINWSWNGVVQPSINFVGLLDTNNGSFPQDTAIFLGSRTFTAGIGEQLEVWTSMPNGVADTVTQDDSLITELKSSLSGTFTIDPAGSGPSNYFTFADAVSDLNDFGVCGPVTINIKDGTYPEQVSIDKIDGASMMNTITFQADPANTSPVELTAGGSSAANYIVRLSGAEWIVFDGINITNQNTFYSRTIEVASRAQNNIVKNCSLVAPPSTSTSNFRANVYARETDLHNNTFENNVISGGSYGIHYFSNFNPPYNDGLKVMGNEIVNCYYMGLYLYGTTNAEVSNNTIMSQSTYAFGYAIYSYYGGENNKITSNTVMTNGTNQWPLYGFRGFGYTSTDTTRAIVANNMFHVGTPGVTRTNYGIYAQNMPFTDFVYNNVALEGASNFGRAGYFLGTGGGSRVLNNNFLSYGNGYGLYVNPGGATEVDYNNIASAGPNIGYYGSNAADLMAWRTAGGGDSTISVDSIYTNLDSMRTCDARIASKGKAVSGYALDFDGDNRHPENPNIGADEFIAVAEAFTIGDSINFCGGSEVVLGTSMDGGTFQWSTGATTDKITVTQEGNYSVTVNGPCVSGMTDDVEVIDINPVASFTIGQGIFIRAFQNTSEYGSTYMWDFGDGTTSTQFNPWHEYAENGSYDVTLTVMNECDTVTITQTVSITVGVNEIELDKQISVYPNPANDFFNIAIGELEDQTVQMELIDMKGQVYTNQLIKVTAGTVETIDVSSLSRGVYMLRLTSSNEVTTKQIVIQ